MISFGKLEEEVYKKHMENCRRELEETLKALDDMIYSELGEGWEVVRKDTRNLTTCAGPVKIMRRYYRCKANGMYYHLLDHLLGLEKYDQFSPLATQMFTALGTEAPYRKGSDFLARYHNINVSHMKIWETIQDVGKTLKDREKQEKHNVYTCGGIPSKCGTKVSSELFIEADGVFVSCQERGRKKKGKRKKKKMEIKMGYSYDGRHEDSSSGGRETRYVLDGKRYYSGVCGGRDFWENMSLKINEKWNLSSTSLFAIGGDGAEWIHRGVDFFPNSIFQLDRFHFQRAVSRTFGIAGKERKELTQWLDNPPDVASAGEYFAQVRSSCTDEKKLRKISELEVYITRHLPYIKDYRKRLGRPELPPLGTCEGNIDKLLANRFKKRGMSWSEKGANHLSKVIVALKNGDSPQTADKSILPGLEAINIRKILKKQKEVFRFTQGVIPELAESRSEMRDSLRRLVMN